MNLLHSLLSLPSRPAATGAPAPAAERTVRPDYELTETDDAYGLTVQLPGVAKDGLELTVEEEVIRLRGHRAWTPPAGWTALHRETADAPFELVLDHGHAVQADRIAAELRDGLLRVSLPKSDAVKPRRIAVT